MGWMDRLFVAFILFAGATVLGAFHIYALLPFIDMAETQFTGPFTSVVGIIPTVMVAIIGILYLGSGLFILVGPVQEEKSVQTVARRRP